MTWMLFVSPYKAIHCPTWVPAWVKVIKIDNGACMQGMYETDWQDSLWVLSDIQIFAMWNGKMIRQSNWETYTNISIHITHESDRNFTLRQGQNKLYTQHPKQVFSPFTKTQRPYSLWLDVRQNSSLCYYYLSFQHAKAHILLATDTQQQVGHFCNCYFAFLQNTQKKITICPCTLSIFLVNNRLTVCWRNSLMRIQCCANCSSSLLQTFSFTILVIIIIVIDLINENSTICIYIY